LHYKILIVEDDRIIASSIAKQAELWDMDARIASDFRDILSEFAQYQPHLVLLDVSLPFYNGYHWCEEIRKVSKVPIIFVTSASDNLNIIMAMNMGADDFIAKPFDLSVLIAKMQALLRRSYAFADTGNTIEHKGASLNTDDGSLMYNGKQIVLSKNEFRILLTLMKSKGTTVSREKLMEILWQTDEFVDDNTLTVNVNRLRKKLDAAGLDNFISTRFGVGYVVEI